MSQAKNQKLVDDVIAYIFIKNLIKPITKSKAYGLGLVDEHGRIKREPVTPVEIEALSSMDMIVFKLKRLLGNRIVQLNKFIYLNAWDDKPNNYLMVKGGLSRNRVNQTANEIWQLRESVEEEMPSNLVKAYAKKYNKTVDEVESIWNKNKKAILDSGKNENDDGFWAIVNNLTKKELEKNTVNECYRYITLIGNYYADALYEEGKKIKGRKGEETKTKDFTKMKNYLRKLLNTEEYAGAAVTTVDSAGLTGAPEGGAGKGIFANKIGKIQKRKLKRKNKYGEL